MVHDHIDSEPEHNDASLQDAAPSVETPQSKTWGDLIYLSLCALENQAADEAIVAEMDLPAILHTAQQHSISALIASPLLALWESHPTDEAAMAPWKRADNRAAYRYLTTLAERQEISDWMEQQHIWHMPLKGALLCELYPANYLRECSDVDILFDTTHRNKVRTYMEQRGYSYKTHEHHDIYIKQPVFNIEMHRGLTWPTSSSTWNSFYKNIPERLMSAEGRSFELRFTNKDFYLYTIVHAVQHVYEGGTGLRTVLDIAVMLRSWGNTLDWQRIDADTETLGIAKYEHIWRSIATKLYVDYKSQQALTDDELNALEALLECGTYGGLDDRLQQRILDRQTATGGIGLAKLMYLKERVFPSYQEMSQYREPLQKHPWLLPFYWGTRFIRGVSHKARREELRRVLDL